MNRDQIKAILLNHGFRIPWDMIDQKPYIYEAVEAVLAEAAVPEGWRLVPEHPTPEMLVAINWYDAVGYRCMLAAAPKPPVANENTSSKRVRNPAEIEHEPVAWMYPDDYERMKTSETYCTVFSVEVGSPTQGTTTVPLYVHSPTLQLPEPMTDKAIVLASAPWHWNLATGQTLADLKAFARAIEAETLRRVKEANK